VKEGAKKRNREKKNTQPRKQQQTQSAEIDPTMEGKANVPN